VPGQLVMPFRHQKIPVLNLNEVSGSKREEISMEKLLDEARRPFDLSLGKLLRVTLFQLDPDEHLLLIVTHHFAVDGWSLIILFKELSYIYNTLSEGGRPELRPLSMKYTEISERQKKVTDEDIPEEISAYWKKKLSNSPSLLELSLDKPEEIDQSDGGSTWYFEFPEDLAAKVREFARNKGITLYTVLLATYQLLLFRYSFQKTILVGTSVSNREKIEQEDLIGPLWNNLIFRMDFSPDLCFGDLVNSVFSEIIETYSHRQIPYKSLVKELSLPRSHGFNPLFQFAFNLHQRSEEQGLRLNGLTLQSLEVDHGTARFDGELDIKDEGHSLSGKFEFSHHLYPYPVGKQFIEHYLNLLRTGISNPERNVTQLPLLSPSERDEVLAVMNKGEVIFPEAACIHHLIEFQARQKPDATGLIYKDTSMSYIELDHRANQLGNYLQNAGVKPEVYVGICVERSLDMMVGIVGILKAGGAYVPLDPLYPMERLQTIIDDADVAMVVTQEHLKSQFSSSHRIVTLDTDWSEISEQSSASPLCSVIPDNPAYVMYTSGSTGKPKGVVISHRNVLSFLYGFSTITSYGDTRRGTSMITYNFDTSVEEIFSTLCFGGELHLIKPEESIDTAFLARYLVDHHITTSYIVPDLIPDLAVHLAEMKEQMNLKCLLTGLAPKKQKVLQKIRDLSDDLRIINGYGPTEVTYGATALQFERATAPERDTPIGIAFPNYRVCLFDPFIEFVPRSFAGELCITGRSLARGYLHHPEITAEKFMPDPLCFCPGERMYRTGDKTCLLEDGSIDFRGRFDNQVKVRGYRIELGEIEHALGRHPYVKENVVLLKKASGGDKKLVAYVVFRSPHDLQTAELRGHLKEMLPEYMIPAFFVRMNALPRMPNDKIDKGALPMPKMSGLQTDKTLVAPSTKVEHVLAQVWKEVLHLDDISIQDNFFEIGGDSILSIQIVSRVRQAGLDLTLRQFFEHQTISELSQTVGVLTPLASSPKAVTGVVPLTPIQHWFFEQNFRNPSHFNMSLLLQVPANLDATTLERFLELLVSNHDAFRLLFKPTKQGFEQWYYDDENTVSLSCFDLSELNDDKKAWIIQEHAERMQSTLQLDESPLMKAGYFTSGPDQASYLLIIAHHLIVDGISWRIITEDLESLYKQELEGRSLQLPPEATSYQLWAEKLQSFAQQLPVTDEIAFWLNHPWATFQNMPVDYDDKNDITIEASGATVMVTLEEELTHSLLFDISTAYNTRINEVLLTALAGAWRTWTGQDILFLDLEGHGREDIFDQVDLSRTVGWFTNLFPVCLDLQAEVLPERTLLTVKEQLRKIPGNGLSFGLLRYLNNDEGIGQQLSSLPRRQICFNYMGQMEFHSPVSMFKNLWNQPRGRHLNKQESRRYLLEINASVVQGRLQVKWHYSNDIHLPETIENLAGNYIKELKQLISHCLSPAAGGYSPSDFPDIDFSQTELDQLLDDIDDDGLN